MKAEELRDLNVIGAFALALSDDFRGAMQELAEGNESACAALIVIGQESGLSSTACRRSWDCRSPARCAWSTGSLPTTWSSANPAPIAARSPCA